MSDERQARVLRALDAATTRLEEDERRRTEPIAIVGIGCRFPGGAGDPESFWRLLCDGTDAVGEFPAGRFDLDEVFDADPDARGKTPVRRGAFLQDVDRFDAALFGISPREADSLDPQQRLLLETAWEALERAGLTRERLCGSRTGVYVGITNGDYGRQIAKSLDRLDSYYVTGNTLNAAAGRLAYLFGLRGPSLAIDTACSSSLVAVHLACQSLRARECDAALAAGVNLVLSPEGLIALSKSRVLSPDGSCKSFDASADGMGRGEGCGVLVLKRLSDAERDGDSIVALIAGSAINQDGASAGLTVPNGPAQEDVVREALASARVAPGDIDYVEAHGTGTPLGDPIELRALGEVFRDDRPDGRPLMVGAVKANIAHGESSAGMAGIIKTALCLQHESIPRQIHYRVGSPHVDWDDLPIVVPVNQTAWPAGGRRRLAGVSGFGFSGTNAHLVLSEAPSHLSADRAAFVPGPCVLTVSGGDAAALQGAAARYAQHLREREATRLDDFCLSAAITRNHHAHRAAIVASTTGEAIAALEAIAAGRRAAGAVDKVDAGARGGVAFLFSGQGAQFAGMGRGLYASEPVFRRAVDACSSVLGRDVLAIAADASDDTAFAQPALFAFECALTVLWQSWGVSPAAVIGHSIGELTAACVAGVFGLEDGISLSAARGALMSALPRGGMMTAVFAPETEVARLVSEFGGGVSIAAINAPDHVVISGDRESVEDLSARLRTSSVVCKPLSVSHAFHSPAMTPMLEAWREELSRVTFRAPSIPYFSGMTGERAGGEVASADYWVRHVMEPVRFGRGMTALHDAGHRVFLEAGPHATLTGLGRATVTDEDARWIASLKRGEDDGAQIALAVADLHACGVAIDWPSVFAQRGAKRIALPTYPFQRKRYWFQERDEHAGADSDRLFELDWVPEPVAPASGVAARWLILADASGVGADLADRIRARGEQVDILSSDTREDLARVLDQALSSDASAPLAVVHLWSLDIVAGDSDADWDRMQALGCLSALDIIKAAARHPKALRVWLVTKGAQAAHPAVWQAPLWGLARVAAIEHPDLLGGIVDLDPASADAAMLDLETRGSSGASQAMYRGATRCVPRLRRASAVTADMLSWSGDASYLVTGGLGGVGLRIAEWMVSQGARRIVLSGRRPPAPDVRSRLDRLIDTGTQIIIVLDDVSNAAGAARVIGAADALGPLRGIVHAAGVLDDAVLVRQDADRFARAMAGKARGAVHLDRLAQGRELDFFVLCSSLASIVGSPGQGNYAAANALLDALSWSRRARGEAAVSVNWGPWAESGMAARLDQAGRDAMTARGLAPLSTLQGLRLVNRVLRQTVPQIVAVSWDPSLVRRSMPAVNLSILDAIAPAALTSDRAASNAPASTVAPATASDAARYLRDRIGAILRLADDRILTGERSLQETGLDSMMATELRNRIRRDLQVDVPIARFLGGATLHALAAALLEHLTLARVATGPAASETEEFVL